MLHELATTPSGQSSEGRLYPTPWLPIPTPFLLPGESYRFGLKNLQSGVC